MAATTKDRNTPYREGTQLVAGVKANAVCFAGALAALGSDGYAVPASDTAGLKVVGRFEEFVDNTGGASGAKVVTIREGVYKYVGANLTIADIGKPCFVSDDQTVSVAATNNDVVAGIIVGVESATEPWVLTGLSVRAGAALADTVAADLAALKVDFNALLALLRTGRIIAS